MANDWWTDDEDDDDTPTPPKREELPEGARKHLRNLEKQVKTLMEENNKLKVSQRNTTVTDIVKAKGYNPAIASFVPSDVEVTDESVGKWLETHGELFAKPVTGDAASVTGAADAAAGYDIPPELAEAMNLIGNISAGAVTPQKPADLLQKIQSSTQEEFMQLLKQQGATV
jgi:hypothetical protein